MLSYRPHRKPVCRSGFRRQSPPDGGATHLSHRGKRTARNRKLPPSLLAITWVGLCFAVALRGGAAAAADIEPLREAAMRDTVRAVAPSVVRIETFAGLERVGRMAVASGPTTGLVVSEDGYIVSSEFNFVQKPASILVTLPDGQRLPATIVARDHSRMLVLLKVNTDQKLLVPTPVPRDEMYVGQWALAIGRTYGGQLPSMSAGIVSAVNRIWSKAIQTDAKVSPSNYGGPLVDIRGRVFGVLVPLSPEGQGALAGAEWYDSGIGFAIPLVDVNRQLERLRQGQDLHGGLLGISLKGSDLFSEPVSIVACHPNSPAAKAGLKAGDRIVEIDGQAIETQAQLKHELGPRYAGERVRVAVLRGDDRIEVEVELTDAIQPYENPFLGILPRRDRDDAPAVVVRYVYPGSPADEAGIQVGDALTHLADDAVADVAACYEQFAQYQPGDSLPVRLRRGGSTLTLSVTLGRLPVAIPPELPAAHDPVEPADNRPEVGEVEIKLPEEPNDCFAYVPDSYQASVPHGVVLWLDAPGSQAKPQLIQLWKDHCRDHDLILLAPQPANPDRWQGTEADFVAKVLNELINRYEIDPTRVVVHGYQGGATLAFRLAFTQRDVIRGVAAVDGVLPMRIPPPANDPMLRLAIYTTMAEQSDTAERMAEGVQGLRALKYPVTVKEQTGEARYLNPDELTELVRWIDSLDRI